MKKLAVVVVLAAVVAAGALWFARRPSVAGPKDSNPFEKPYKLDADAAQAYIDGDPIEFAAASGRFYWPGSDIPGKLASEYDEARRAKVLEIVGAANDLSVAVNETFTAMMPSYFKMLDLAQTLRKADPKASAGIGKALGQFQVPYVKSLASMHCAGALGDAMPEEPYTSALMSELSVLKVAEGGAAALETAELLLTSSALFALVAEAKGGAPAEAAKALEKELDGANTFRAALEKVGKSLAIVSNGFRQLEIADTEYGRAALQSIQARAPKVLEAAKKLKPSEYLSAGDIAFASGMAELCAGWAAEASKGLGAPHASLSRPSRPGDAWAAGEEAYSSGFRTLKQSAADLAGGAYQMGSATLGAAKEGFRKLQRGVQLGTDYLATGASMTTRVGLGVYYGDKPEDIKNDLFKMGQELKDNWNGKLPKKTTLRQAKELLDEVEQTADDAARVGAEGVFGAGWKSWMVGKGAKMVVGAFNGLAKGIYLVGDPNSGAADYVEGSIELIFAGMGGTKTVIKASQTPQLAQKGAQLAREGWKVFSTSRIEAQIARLTELLGKEGADDLAKMLSNLRELAASRDSLEAMKAAQEAFKERLKKAAAEALRGMGKEAGEGLRDMMQKQFGRGLEGLLAAMQSATGGTRREVFDTLMGSLADEFIQNATVDLFRDRLAQADIAGTFKGTLTFQAIDIDEKALKEQAKKSGDEGCMDMDLSPAMLAALKDMIGKSQPTSMHVRPLGDDRGTLTFMSNGKRSGNALKYTYSDSGEFVAEGAEKGSTISIVGKFTKTEAGNVTFEGQAKAESPGAQIAAAIRVDK